MTNLYVRTAWLVMACLAAISTNAQSPSKFGGSPIAAKATHEILEAASAERARRALPPSLQDRLAQSRRGQDIQFIVVHTGDDKAIAAQARALGFTVQGTHLLPGNIHHTVLRGNQVSPLLEIAARPDVIQVTPEPPRRPRSGTVVTQGDISMRSNLARTNFNVTGAGIRVGVISDSISRTPAVGGTISGGFLTGSNPQNSGNLPPSIRVLNNGSSSDTDEGAAMLEIVHDIAPGSPLSFADVDTYSQFANNITALRNDPGFQCKIIVDDIGYLAEPTYQAGHIEVAANLCLPNNVLYFSAFGNDGEDAHEAPFTDPDPATDLADPPSGVNLHDFGLAMGLASDKFITLQVPNGARIDVVLRWDEPGNGTFAQGSGATSDLDLYLLNSTALPITPATIRVKSDSSQGTISTPSGSPFEYAAFNNTSGTNQTVHIAVNHYHGRVPDRVHLSIYASSSVIFTDRHLVRGFSSWGHPNGNNVIGIAAVFFGEVDTSGTLDGNPNQINVEPFSSKGGLVPRLIADNGVRLITPENRAKPELTAPDGGNTSFFGQDIGFDTDSFPNFFGTSAAAPHAAAAAALVWSARPSLTAAEVLAALNATARDIETPGFDFLSGLGLIDANAAVQSVLVAGARDWSLYD
jgi:subtilisin family serine protease